MKNQPILSLLNITFNYGDSRNTLDNISCDIYENDTLAIVGRSGCGKSTMIQVMAGLLQPTSGQVLYRGKSCLGVTPNTSIVMQECVLFPWMNVLENVVLGIDMLSLPLIEKQKRALNVLRQMGLNGFETAYPRELSGGMRQRVSIARALVVEPDIVFLDEPFSSLDALTIDNLWEDLSSLDNTIVFITHDIEEAVLYSKHILVMGGGFGMNINIDLPRQRDTLSAQVRQKIDDVYCALSTMSTPTNNLTGFNLVDIEVSEIIGLMLALKELRDSDPHKLIDLPLLAEHADVDSADLFDISETLVLLGFVVINNGDIDMTKLGREFVEADMEVRTLIFAQSMLKNIPFAKKVIGFLKAQFTATFEQLMPLLSPLSSEQSERLLKVFIRWARYAELIGYDDAANKVYLQDNCL